MESTKKDEARKHEEAKPHMEVLEHQVAKHQGQNSKKKEVSKLKKSRRFDF